MIKYALLLVAALCGCATHNAKITITRINGEPSVSFEIQKKEICNEDW